METHMDPVNPEELIELAASAKTFATTGAPDSGTYRRITEDLHRSGMPGWARANYLFSLPTWDVFELLTDSTVRVFSDNLRHAELKIPMEKEDYQAIGPIQPVLRYLLLTPSSPDLEERQEALRLLGAPIIDRAVTVALLLVDDDVYVPLAAEYQGTEAQNNDKKKAVDAIFQAATGLTNDLSDIKKSIEIPPHVLDVVRIVKTKNVQSKHKIREVVDTLMRLNDEAFMTAVSFILPYTWDRNTWFASEPRLAERAFRIVEARPGLRESLRKSGLKTSWMMPAPFDPFMIYIIPGGTDFRGNPTSRREKDALEKPS